MRPTRKLTLVPLAAATYFMVSGGPYGLEELVQDCGYRTGLLILLLIPLVWSLPTGLMVGELSAAIPDEGGFYVWVRRAMGPFWGFQEAWLSLVASVFDMAAYPALFVLYLGRLWPAATQGFNGMLIGAAVVAACVVWNLAGARAVGTGSVLLGILLLSPFLLIVIFALVRHPALGATPVTAGGAQGGLLAGIMVAMWNYMGWDNASTVAGEVENPQRTYPRVMMAALAATVLSYVIPVGAVWRTHVPPAYWATGSWAGIASLVAGPWLGLALVLAAMISSLGIFNSLTMSYSRLPIAMAEAGYAPRAFLRRMPNGAPWVSILVCGLAWSAALGLSFDRLLMLDILLYGASLVLEFVALVVLRVREPGLDRPFTVPGGLAGAVLSGVGPTALLVVALIRNRNEQMGRISALTVGLIFMAAGVVAWYMAKWAHQANNPEKRQPFS
jgi:amino acid transporter